MPCFLIIKGKLTNLIKARAVKIKNESLAVIRKVTANLTGARSVRSVGLLSIAAAIADLLTVFYDIMTIARLNRTCELVQLQTEVDTFLLTSETDFSEKFSRSYIVTAKLDFVIHTGYLRNVVGFILLTLLLYRVW